MLKYDKDINGEDISGWIKNTEGSKHTWNYITKDISYLKNAAQSSSYLFEKIIENKIQSLDMINSELIYKKNSFFESSKNKISKNTIEFYSPLNYCKNQMLNLSSKAKLLNSVYKSIIDRKYYLFVNKPESINEKCEKIIGAMRLKYTKSSTALEAYSYANILEKGFALIKNENNQSIIRSKNITIDTNATIHFYDGTIKALLKKNG